MNFLEVNSKASLEVMNKAFMDKVRQAHLRDLRYKESLYTTAINFARANPCTAAVIVGVGLVVAAFITHYVYTYYSNQAESKRRADYKSKVLDKDNKELLVLNEGLKVKLKDSVGGYNETKASLENSTQQVTNLTITNQALQESLQSWCNQKEELSQQLLTLKNAAEEQAKRLEELEKELLQSKEENENVIKQNSELQTNLESELGERENLNQQLLTLKNAAEEQGTKVTELKEELGKSQNEVATLKSEKENLINRDIESQSALSALNKAFDKSSADVNNLKSGNENLTNKNGELQSELNAFQDSFNNLKSENQSLAKQNSELQENFQLVTEEKKKAEEKSKQQAERFEEKIIEMKTIESEIGKKLDVAYGELHEEKRQKLAIQDSYDTLQKDIKQLNSDLGSYKPYYGAYQRLMSIKEKIVALELGDNSLETDEEIEKYIYSILEEVVKLRPSCKDLQMQLNERTEEVEKLQKLYQESESKLNEAQLQLQQKTAELKTKESELQQLREELQAAKEKAVRNSNELQITIANLQSQLKEKAGKVEELRQLREELEEAKQKSEQKANELQLDLREREEVTLKLGEERNELERRNQALQAEKDGVDKAVLELNGNISDLQSKLQQAEEKLNLVEENLEKEVAEGISALEEAVRLEEELWKLREELKEAKANAEKEKTDLLTTIKTLESNVKDQTEELKRKESEFEKSYQALEVDKENAEQQANELQEKLDEAQVELSKQKKELEGNQTILKQLDDMITERMEVLTSRSEKLDQDIVALERGVKNYNIAKNLVKKLSKLENYSKSFNPRKVDSHSIKSQQNQKENRAQQIKELKEKVEQLQLQLSEKEELKDQRNKELYELQTMAIEQYITKSVLNHTKANNIIATAKEAVNSGCLNNNPGEYIDRLYNVIFPDNSRGYILQEDKLQAIEGVVKGTIDDASTQSKQLLRYINNRKLTRENERLRKELEEHAANSNHHSVASTPSRNFSTNSTPASHSKLRSIVRITKSIKIGKSKENSHRQYESVMENTVGNNFPPDIKLNQMQSQTQQIFNYIIQYKTGNDNDKSVDMKGFKIQDLVKPHIETNPFNQDNVDDSSVQTSSSGGSSQNKEPNNRKKTSCPSAPKKFKQGSKNDVMGKKNVKHGNNTNKSISIVNGKGSIHLENNNSNNTTTRPPLNNITNNIILNKNAVLKKIKKNTAKQLGSAKDFVGLNAERYAGCKFQKTVYSNKAHMESAYQIAMDYILKDKSNKFSNALNKLKPVDNNYVIQDTIDNNYYLLYSWCEAVMATYKTSKSKSSDDAISSCLNKYIYHLLNPNLKFEGCSLVDDIKSSLKYETSARNYSLGDITKSSIIAWSKNAGDNIEEFLAKFNENLLTTEGREFIKNTLGSKQHAPSHVPGR